MQPLASINHILTIIPSELSFREPSLTLIIGLSLFVSFLLIAFAKLLKPDIYWGLMISNLKISSLSAHLRDSYPILKGGSLLLMFNYWIAFSSVLYVIFGGVNDISSYEWIAVGAVPIVFLIWSLGSMIAIGVISGERQVFSEAIAMKLLGAQLLGIVLFVVAAIAALYSVDTNTILQVVIWALIIESIIRFYKSIVAVYMRGVSWYYIILYFCTLEILPLFTTYYVVIKDFN